MSTRKPHAGNAGYVCELRARLGGHIVIYDRDAMNGAIEVDYRWIVMHEPSSIHVAVKSMAHARDVMKGVAKATTIDEANGHAQIVPQPADNNSCAVDDDGADETVRHQERLAKRGPSDEVRSAALARFMADPENEPSAEGKAALKVAFDLPQGGGSNG